jgi:hypothetical protein
MYGPVDPAAQEHFNPVFHGITPLSEQLNLQTT